MYSITNLLPYLLLARLRVTITVLFRFGEVSTFSIQGDLVQESLVYLWNN